MASLWDLPVTDKDELRRCRDLSNRLGKIKADLEPWIRIAEKWDCGRIAATASAAAVSSEEVATRES